MSRTSPTLPLALVGVAGLVVVAVLTQLADGPRSPAGDAGAPPVVDLAAPADDGPATPTPAEAAPTPLTTDADGGPPEPAVPPAELRVPVVDEDGEPLGGVPVSFRFHAPRAPLPQELARAGTAADGLAVLDLSDAVLVDGAFTAPEGRLDVAVDLPLTPPVALDLGTSVTVGRLPPLVVPRDALLWTEPIRVRLLDADGRPVPRETVVLQRALAAEPDDPDALEYAVTDDDGVASLPRDRIVESAARLALLGAAAEYRVSVDGLLEDPPWAPVPVPPDGGTVELRLPPTGSVTVHVTDHTGAPADDAGVAVWRRPAGADDDVRFERPHDHLRHTVDGVARYEHVGLGLELRLGVSAVGTRGASLAVDGPVSAGEDVALHAALGEPLPWLTGRIVDADGAPVAETFHASVRPAVASRGPALDEADDGWWFPVTTDADGRFRHAVLPERVPAGSELVAEERPRSGAPRGDVARFGRVALPAPFPVAGDVDVGELVLRPLPLVVSGTVVDGAGRPLSVKLSVRHPVLDGQDVEWQVLDHRLSSDAEGRFALHSIDRPKALRLQASHHELGRSEPVEVAPGTTDVRLELVPPVPEAERPAGVVEGAVLLDPGIPPMALEVLLRWDGGSEDESVWPDVGYRVPDVPPGTARLVVATRETDFEVAEVTDIEVRDGETTRVDAIDLRGALGLLDLLVVKPGGKPVSDTWCRIASDAQRGGTFRTSRDGRARLLLPTDAPRFLVGTLGPAETPVAWSDTEQTVVLPAE